MNFETCIGKLKVSSHQLNTIESITELKGRLAVDEVVITMLEEFIWPDQSTFNKYIEIMSAS